MILVADDEDDVRELLVLLLAGEGFNVVQARDGLEVIAAIDDETPDLILLDIRMPRLDGFGAYRAIRERPELDATPVLFVSAKGDSETIVSAFDGGIDDYIVKPFDERVLMARIRNLLAKRRQKAKADPYGFEPGSLVDDRYQVLRTLGTGGTSVVYEVRDLESGNLVALKAIRPNPNPGWAVARFEREAEATARFDHPNLVRLYDAEFRGDLMYYTMEVLADDSVGDLIAEHGALGVHRSLDIAAKVADALHHAHALGYLHRDVKPDNILLCHSGRPVLTDFGLVLDGEKVALKRVTEPGMVMGTLGYMAPEALVARGRVDARTDIFSLGTTLFEMLAARLPTDDPEFRSSESLGLIDPVPFVAAYLSFAPAPVRAVCTKALQMTPVARYNTAEEMAEACRTALDMIGSAPVTHELDE